VAEEWSARVERASKTFTARHLYCGRVVTETFRASEAVRGNVVFISAGLGLVAEDAQIPSYSLTSTRGSLDSIAARLTEPYEAPKWWRVLTKVRGSEDLLTRSLSGYHGNLVLVALPSTYLGLICEELASLPKSVRTRLRILGPRGDAELGESLRAQWVPYDGRLDNPRSGFNGTASDFPQRALRHFVAQIVPQAPRANCAEHASLVAAALRHMRPYVRRQGRRASDEEVLSRIASLWVRFAGRRNLILRELRGPLGIACEQTRFRKLAESYVRTCRGT
jgi:hypothetical protein